MNFMEEIFEIRNCIEILFLNVNPIPSTKYFKPWHSNVARVSGSQLDMNRITTITVLAYLVLHYRSQYMSSVNQWTHNSISRGQARLDNTARTAALNYTYDIQIIKIKHRRIVFNFKHETWWKWFNILLAINNFGSQTRQNSTKVTCKPVRTVTCHLTQLSANWPTLQTSDWTWLLLHTLQLHDQTQIVAETHAGCMETRLMPTCYKWWLISLYFFLELIISLITYFS